MESRAAPHLYLINTIYPERLWFGELDAGTRFLTSSLLFYFLLLTHPFSFLRFVYNWNTTWFGVFYGVLSVLLYVQYPVLVMTWAAWKRIKPFLAKQEDDWMMAGPGRVFFLSPEGRLSTWFWDSYLELSQMVGVFLMCKKTGALDLAVEHSVVDTITDKNFWRSVMEEAGVRVPMEIGRFDHGEVRINKDFAVKGTDLVCKVSDSYLGIGDKFLEAKEVQSIDNLKRIAKGSEDWKGKQVLLLEWMRPKESLGVHSLDIVTIITEAGPKVLSVLYWGECTGASSHTAKGGYCVDIESEMILSPARFYSPYFSKQPGKLVGTKLPGLKTAVDMSLRAHALAHKKQAWLMMIGWDCMFTKKDGEVVFFEGNFAASRIHRRITFSPLHAYRFLRSYF